MDDARLILAALALACGCRGAEAEPQTREVPAPTGPDEPRHGIDVPAAWQELPAVAEAATAAARAVIEGVDVHAHAWGEPSRGCYLAVVGLTGQRSDSIPNVVKGLQVAVAEGVDVEEWTSTPDAEDHAELGARFVGKGMTGQLRVSLVLDARRIPRALAAACFYNDRQPGVCENACTPLLAMMKLLEPPPATP